MNNSDGVENGFPPVTNYQIILNSTVNKATHTGGTIMGNLKSIFEDTGIELYGRGDSLTDIWITNMNAEYDYEDEFEQMDLVFSLLGDGVVKNKLRVVY